VLTAVSCLVLSACGGADSEPPEPKASGVPSSVAQDDWLGATVEIDQPDGLAVLGDAVYVKTDKGDVVRVDRSSGTIVGSVEVDQQNDAGHYCMGIGSDGTSLWTCSAGPDGTDLVRLDPETLDITERAGVDKVFDQLTLPVVDGRVWSIVGAGDHVTVVDESTSDTASYPLGRRCFQLAATTDRVFLTCSLSDEVLALDAGTGKVLVTADVQNPVNISAVGDDVWVSGSDGLHRLTADLEPVTTYAGLSAGPEGDLVATPDAVWIRQPEGFLFRLDLASGESTRYVIDPVPSGGSVLATGDEVWVSEFNDNVVRRVDPGLP
jgi:streptogramin lyase